MVEVDPAGIQMLVGGKEQEVEDMVGIDEDPAGHDPHGGAQGRAR